MFRHGLISSACKHLLSAVKKIPQTLAYLASAGLGTAMASAVIDKCPLQVPNVPS